MTKRRTKKFRPKNKSSIKKSKTAAQSKICDSPELVKREKWFDIGIALLLLVFGTYQSILYFGHKVVPISDFVAITKVAHELLSFNLPTSFKYAPVVGILQVWLGSFFNSNYPDLLGGWLLNAILHPLNLLLFWLVGKKMLGKSAAWFALIAILNPWTLYMLREPLIETPLLFFILLTFYLIFKRSRWCYLFAAVATMVRYEGAALIMASFVMDMIHAQNKKQRLHALLLSIIASLPLIIWMMGTLLKLDSEGSHYFSVLFSKKYASGFREPVEDRRGLLMHANILWQVGFRPLLIPPQSWSRNSVQDLWAISKTIVTACFFFGCIYALSKRRWEILALLIFLVPYFVLHAIYPYPIQRYHATDFWIVLMISLFGLRSIWTLINGRDRIPRPLVSVAQAFLVLVATIWIAGLLPHLSDAAKASPRSASLPYLAMLVTALIFAGHLYMYKLKYLPRELAVAALVILVVVSNQFILVSFLSDGKADAEFKLLADWYNTNAKKDEKMVVYMTSVTRFFAPKRADDILAYPKAESSQQLVQALYEKNVTYVVWTSREGLRDIHYGYRNLGLVQNIAFLKTTHSIGPYEFITQIQSTHGYINVFRLKKAYPSHPN